MWKNRWAAKWLVDGSLYYIRVSFRHVKIHPVRVFIHQLDHPVVRDEGLPFQFGSHQVGARRQAGQGIAAVCASRSCVAVIIRDRHTGQGQAVFAGHLAGNGKGR